MERNLHTGEKLNEVCEFRVAAWIPSSTDSDSVKIGSHPLEVSQRFLPNLAKRLPAPVIFPNTPAAVITAYLVGRAMDTPEGPGLLHMLKITIFTEPPAVDTGPSPDINGQLYHTTNNVGNSGA
jgi:hypothetical protein